MDHFGLAIQEPDLGHWTRVTKQAPASAPLVRIALIGKYSASKDTYKSVSEALRHTQAHSRIRVEIVPVDAEHITTLSVSTLLRDVQGILVPGGFGSRGIAGKILAAGYARQQKIPYLGICLGMQVAVIEFARSVLGLTHADSTECNTHTPDPVVDLMESQKRLTQKGGTMRLGGQTCTLKAGSRAAQLYGTHQISERHRHRYEFNTQYVARYEAVGMVVSGTHPHYGLPEIIEIPDHPHFIACQFHPELQSTPYRPHPLFISLVHAAYEYGTTHPGLVQHIDGALQRADRDTL